MRAFPQYGENVGLAFQITDDLLDIVGEQEKMGKGVRKDAKHGKLTYPALLGVEESRERARALIAEACCSLAGFGEREAALGGAGALRSGERPLMNFEILPGIESPKNLRALTDEQLCG